jgi:hypothetical protein
MTDLRAAATAAGGGEAVERRRFATADRNEGGERRFAYILKEDPDLAQGLTDEDRRVAAEVLRAPVMFVRSPRWTPPESMPANCLGLLVLDGLLGRRLRVGPAVATELLSYGDILRPWDQPAAWNLIPPELDWRVFRPARLAVLDERVTNLICRRAELVNAFTSRLLRRAHYGQYLMAISHLTRVEDKLLATLWHIASSWGRVTPHGVTIPFRLTHEVLGEILGAQRPSVTQAMGQLQQRNEVVRAADGRYVLTGDPAQWGPRRWPDRRGGGGAPRLA